MRTGFTLVEVCTVTVNVLGVCTWRESSSALSSVCTDSDPFCPMSSYVVRRTLILSRSFCTAATMTFIGDVVYNMHIHSNDYSTSEPRRTPYRLTVFLR